jgi:predicted nuclease of predicted toxin-antitoxin system
MRLLIDMNLAPRWVQTLVAAGHDAVHWSTRDRLSAPDATICKHARDHDFVLITNDLDFPRILAHTLALCFCR